MNTQVSTSPTAPPPAFAALAGQADIAPPTRVSLVYIEHQINFPAPSGGVFAASLNGSSGTVQPTAASGGELDPKRFNLYLRFGQPAQTLRIDRWRRCAVFLPSAIFCHIRWEGNAYGTVRWQLMVMQAATPLDAIQRIPGVQPGARLLLHAAGEKQVRAVLEHIDAIEAQGIAPTAIAPTYWRMLANRLAVRLPLPDYTVHRHAAWLARKELS